MTLLLLPLYSLVISTNAAAWTLARPPVAISLRMPMSTMSAAAADEPSPAALDIIPNCFPSFGMSARESMRFNHMIRREEPLFQEVLGLQFLCSVFGSMHGWMFAVIGFGQIAPMMSFVPGRAGYALRTAGWYVFAGVLRLAFFCDSASKLATLQTSRVERVWRRAAGGLSGGLRSLRRASSRRGAGRWPSIGGAPTYHPKRCPRPPLPPREPWEPPPGWTPPAKPLWPAVARGWARGDSAALLVTVAADDMLWASAAAATAADDVLLTSLDACGVEATAEAFNARMSVLVGVGAGRTSTNSALPPSRRDVRVQAIQQLIERQLIQDGLDPERLHLIGGDEPDEEASYFEQGWRLEWGRQADASRDTDAIEALEGLREHLEAAGTAGVHFGVLTTAPEDAAPVDALADAADFVIGAEGLVLPNVAGLVAPEPEQSMWAGLFDVALRRCVRDVRAEQQAVPVATSGASKLPAAGSADEAPALRWVHISSDVQGGVSLATAKGLGARTIWLRPSGDYNVAAGDAADVQLTTLSTSGLQSAMQTLIASPGFGF